MGLGRLNLHLGHVRNVFKCKMTVKTNQKGIFIPCLAWPMKSQEIYKASHLEFSNQKRLPVCIKGEEDAQGIEGKKNFIWDSIRPKVKARLCVAKYGMSRRKTRIDGVLSLSLSYALFLLLSQIRCKNTNGSISMQLR